MKKTLHILLLFMLSVIFFALLPMTADAAPDVSVKFGDVYPGERVSVVLYVESGDVYGVSGSFSYDASVMSFVSVEQLADSPFKTIADGYSFVVYDTSMKRPLSSHTALIEFRFDLKENVKVGDALVFTVNELVVSDGESDYSYAKTDFSSVVKELPEDNCFLSSLTVEGWELSPEFSKENYVYSVTVGPDCASAVVKAVPEDENSSVEISDTTLGKTGNTAINVKVIGKRGGERTYHINVHKEAPDGEAGFLSSLSVEGFLLSPVFSPERKEYAVYIPYEITSLRINAEGANSSDVISVSGAEDLKVGDNTVKIVLTSENGTKSEYSVNAVRNAYYSGGEKPAETPREEKEQSKGTAVPVWLAVVVCVVLLAGGVIGGYYLRKRFPDGVTVAFKKRFGRTKLFK